MAEEIQIAGTNELGKVRNPLAPIGLSIITLGIYYFFWYFKINKELAQIGQARNTEELGTNPGTSLLAVTLGILLIVPPYISLYGTLKRLSAAERLTGLGENTNVVLTLLVYIFVPFVGPFLVQNNQNKVLQAQAGGGAATPAAPAAPAQ